MYVLMEWTIILLYPALARKSLQAFSCVPAGTDPNTGEDVMLLYEDPIIECYTRDYWPMAAAAMYGAVVYCLGFPLLFFILSWRYHADENPHKRSRVLLITASYDEQFYFFESILLLHKLFFTGIIHIIRPGERLQIWAGTIMSLFTFLMHQRTVPFRHNLADVVQTAALLQLLITYITAFLFFQDGGDSAVDPDNDMLGAVLVGINCFCFIVLAVALAVNTFQAGRSALRGRLRYASTGQVSVLRLFESTQAVQLGRVKKELFDSLPGIALSKHRSKFGYHIFLSHAWPGGQDVMKLVKQRIVRMIPTATVFLDVDDLNQGSGTAEVDQSFVVLVYCQPAYFRKPNCIKELFRAILRNKALLCLVDEGSPGSEPFEREEIEKIVRDPDGLFQKIAYKKMEAKCNEMGREWGDPVKWNQAKIPEEWDGERLHAPTPDKVIERLFEFPMIQWQHISSLQDVTMTLIGERMLPETIGDSPETEPRQFISSDGSFKPPRVVHLQGDVSRNTVKLGKLPRRSCFGKPSQKSYHLYCSQYNVGAKELVDELNCRQETIGTVLFTASFDQIAQCEQMLLYLNDNTFRTNVNRDKLVADIQEAYHLGVHVLTVHERPMVGGIVHSHPRHAVAFEDIIEHCPAELQGRAPVTFEAISTRRPSHLMGKPIVSELLSDVLAKCERATVPASKANCIFEFSRDELDELKLKASSRLTEEEYIKGGKWYYAVHKPRNHNILSDIAIALCASAWRTPGITAIVSKIHAYHEEQRLSQRKQGAGALGLLRRAPRASSETTASSEVDVDVAETHGNMHITRTEMAVWAAAKMMQHAGQAAAAAPAVKSPVMMAAESPAVAAAESPAPAEVRSFADNAGVAADTTSNPMSPLVRLGTKWGATITELSHRVGFASPPATDQLNTITKMQTELPTATSSLHA